MAEQAAQDVVKEAQSVGRPAPADDSASPTSTPAAPAATAPIDSPHAPPVDRKPDASLSTADASDHSASEPPAVADGSGGSDTDISRPGSVDPATRDPAHARAHAAVKKPSTFKSVSVTKNFLAKSVVATPAARPGDKTAPAAPPSASAVLAPKPRLVAKLGGGNAPRMLAKVNGAAAGPDASKVWNKNQPVPPPPPKQYTDEELKQQYGIHLATRLQTDEAGKEAKWADIDDDEDDWTPDAVQWMDGTKSSLAAVEPQPPAEEPKSIRKPPEPPIAAPEPAPAPPASAPKPSVTGGTKTILKPGAHAQPVSGKTSLVLKGQPEKPTLVPKSSSAEKKSPWATLPPVEKVPPVPINPPVQQPPPRFSQRESHGYDARPAPTQEIAPDDFNRSWREERGNAPELYNSHSGRYEPVNEMRRPAARDAGLRQQPSVLQRPSQGGPAEPSPAFQTSRANGDMGPAWGRRRNSSNVSAANMRRMSIDRRGPDMAGGPASGERRASQINGADVVAAGPGRGTAAAQTASPKPAHVHPASPRGSVASPAQASPAEDAVEVQKRLMAEKIERARLKKQQEQEAEKQAEAERKERIAKKLAALGPPADAKRPPSRTADKPGRKDKAGAAAVQSPPKPPVPTADGEVAQYGMIKVHQPQPIKKASPPPEPAKTTARPGEPPTSSALPAKPQTATHAKSPSSPNQAAASPSFDTPSRSLARSREPPDTARQPSDPSSTLDRGAVPAGPAPPTPQATWPSAPHPRPWTSQVWGPASTRERALGNGTFVVDPAFHRGQPRAGPQPLPAQPSTSVASLKQPSPQSLYTQPTPLPAMAISKPGPIAPPLAKGWGNFEADIARDDANMAAKARQDRERVGEQFRPEMLETFKDQRGQAQTTLHNKVGPMVVLPESSSRKDDAAKSLHELSPSQQSLGQGTPLQQATGPRASRFFPRPTEPMTPVPPSASTKADSPPPPPETSTHPVYAGDDAHPLVRLPKPSPVVRLPPTAAGNGASENAVTMPVRNQPPGSLPLARNPEWQARFNKLFAKSASTDAPASSSTHASSVNAPAASPKASALAPTALSKASLDVREATGPATVSLPSALPTSLFATDRGKEAVTCKDTQGLFEDREFGSLPTVKLPKSPHLAAAESATGVPKDELLPRWKKFENPFTIRRLEAFDLDKNTQKIEVSIRLPGMHQASMKTMPRRRRGLRASGPFKPKQSGTPNASSASGLKDRLRKPSQQGQADAPGSSSRPTPTNAWSNTSRPSPLPSHSTWGRRAATAH